MKTQLDARPVRFGQANPGMQDKGEDYKGLVTLPYGSGMGAGYEQIRVETAWERAKECAVHFANALFEAGYHKQVYNRLVEPFQMMKTVTSGTEWNNYFWLRHHEAADPTLAELARVMFEAREASVPVELSPGQWHLPYVDDFVVLPNGEVKYMIASTEEGYSHVVMDLDTARKVSAARSAAVSFRNVDYGVDKCLEVYDRLVGDDRKHASAFEHQATPMNLRMTAEYTGINLWHDPDTWEEGVSHMTRDKQLWSGNLKGWIQFRKLIPGENYEG
jgi:hypothetical protein